MNADIKSKINIACRYINLVLLLIFSIQMYNSPDIKTMLWVFAMWAYMGFSRQGKVLDIKAVLLLAGMSIHAYMFSRFNDNFTQQEMLELAVIPFLAYTGGKLLVLFLEEKKLSSGVRWLVLTMAIGITVHATLNYSNYLETGFVIESGKRWLDYWSQIPLFSTEHSFYGAIMAGLLFYGAYELLCRRVDGILVIIGVFWVNYINIQVMNRMVFAITIVVFIFSILVYTYLVRKDKKKIKIISIIAGMLCILMLMIWCFDIGNIKETDFYISLANRDGGIIKNVRFQIYWTAVKQILPCWKGGLQMDLLGYSNAHNFWLQMANESGIVPFLCFSVYIVWNLYDILRILKKKSLDISVKLLLTGAYLGMFCYFMTEQGGNGSAEYIMYLVLLGGIISQTLKRADMEELRELEKISFETVQCKIDIHPDEKRYL